jgi:membrane protein DedA with SNARE-associated domain
MPPEIISFITNYGYLAIFIVIFAQEIGIPNPIPNELVLIFSGYLTLKGILILPLVILVAVIADITGTSILYAVFYFSGGYIYKHKPRWLPLPERSIDKLSKRLSNGGRWKIYIFRLTPFIRGYTSIAIGLLQIKPKIFLPIALISGITWSLICVLTGRILGPYWSYAGNKMGDMKTFLLITVLLIFLILVLVRYLKKRSTTKLE